MDFATKAMGTSDVRIDPKLNQALWAQGIKTVPHRIRIKLEREWWSRIGYVIGELMLLDTGKRNDEENAKEKLFTYASHVPVSSFKVRTLIFLYNGVVFLIFIPPRASKQRWLMRNKFYHAIRGTRCMYTSAMHS